MGICSHKQTIQDNTYSTKAILKCQQFNGINFYFSTESLLRLDSDAVILFSDRKLNLKKNPYLLRVGAFESRKVQQFAESYLSASSLSLEKQEFIIFPISVLNLRFSKAVVICLRPWNGRESLYGNFSEVIKRAFLQIKKQQVTSITLTEVNTQFGVPLNIGSRIFAKQISNSMQFLKTVTILCSSDNSQNTYMQKIRNYTLEHSQFAKSQSADQSVYF